MPAKHLHRVDEDGIYCHIYNKGVEKRVIFNDDEDYRVFLGFLNDYLTPQDSNNNKKTFEVKGRTFQGVPHQPKNYFNKIELVAYSLWPDHFHLVLYQVAKGSLERFARSLTTRYSIYFNKKYQRTGTLFEGPYKSVQINANQISHLTGFLHHFSHNSSLEEYLGSRDTAWVKPEVVLASFKGGDDYKNFVEQYEQNPSNKELVANITFDDQIDHLERSTQVPLERNNLTSNEKKFVPSEPKVRRRIPEFLVTSTVMFLLLVSIGVTNIQISAAKNHQPSASSEVLSEIYEATDEADLNVVIEQYVATSSASVEATSSGTPEATTSGVLEITPELLDSKLNALVIVRVGGEAGVNIRQKPTASSLKVGKASNEEIFELVSEESDWYEIKLTDGTTGFISKQYVTREGLPNE